MAETILHQLGYRIRDLRKENGFTQEQLAELAGFHYTYIGAAERAEKNISVLNLSKIAAALKVDVSELFAYSRLKQRSEG